MNVLTAKDDLSQNPAAKNLVEHLSSRAEHLGLQDADLYYKFPLYRSDDGDLVICPILIVSRRHSVTIIGTSDCTSGDAREMLIRAERELDEVYGQVYARLVKNPILRQGKRELSFGVETIIYAPFLDRQPVGLELEAALVVAPSDLEAAFDSNAFDPDFSDHMFREILATIQGAKGLLRPQRRTLDPSKPTSRGALASKLEAEISAFDLQQKQSYLIDFRGPQRIRGLAGSGKTVILALRAALLHLANPSAQILYTFYTKSLYQHIRRLITRFYRQFDEKDPDWEQIRILHGWGGNSAPGVYFETCRRYGVQPMSYPEASRTSAKEPFDAACSALLRQAAVSPAYDYILIDEGQDFPHSFLRLCQKLSKGEKFVLAYDELQTIFQKTPPTIGEVFGVGEDGRPLLELDQDLVLRKCYRNPREVLVCAHALGFGIYNRHIVQMLENAEHWADIGYRVTKGTFVAGADIEIERPIENSPLSISSALNIDEIVVGRSFKHFDEEVSFVVTSIEADIAEGLRPDDILVVCVDDRNARHYLEQVEASLTGKGVRAHNIHAATYGVVDFRVEGAVTLSTVHKAKGNEAFVVYVVGVDAAFAEPTVRTRNIVFTAMSRAKGWLRVSGVGNGADSFVAELTRAKKNYPFLRFKYPSQLDFQVMRRDLEYDPDQIAEIEEKIAALAEVLSTEELAALLEKLKARSTKQGAKQKKARRETKR